MDISRRISWLAEAALYRNFFIISTSIYICRRYIIWIYFRYFHICLRYSFLILEKRHILFDWVIHYFIFIVYIGIEFASHYISPYLPLCHIRQDVIAGSVDISAHFHFARTKTRPPPTTHARYASGSPNVLLRQCAGSTYLLLSLYYAAYFSRWPW